MMNSLRSGSIPVWECGWWAGGLAFAAFLFGEGGMWPVLADDVSSVQPPVAAMEESRSWPQLRGPSHDGISTETGIADSWPAEGPPVLWAIDFGHGYSSFAAVDDRVYTQTQTLYGQYVVCLDGVTGEEIWTHRYGWPYESAGIYPGPRSTPTVHEGRVYFAGPRGLVGCLDAADGQVVWSLNVVEKFGGRGADFGYACSPVVEGGKVLLPVGGRGACLVALDARDGSTVWQSGDEPASYCSALPITLQGRRQVVVFLQNALAAFDLETGRELWLHKFNQGYDEHAAAPLYREPYLMTASPFRGGSKLYHLQVTDEGRASAEPVRHSDVMSNDVASSLLIDDHVYGFDLRDVQSKAHRASRGIFRCIDLLTGEIRWSTDRVGHASVIAADGKLILFNDTGEVILARIDSQEYQELARTQVFEGEICWTPPALEAGRLYLRTQTRAVCLYLGEPRQLSPEQREAVQTTAQVRHNASADWNLLLGGGEREYPFDRPTRDEFMLWFWAGLAGAFLPAAFLGGTVSFTLGRRERASLIGRSIFWVGAFAGGVAATYFGNRIWPEFVFTWPASLFVAFQLVLMASVHALRTPGQRGPHRTARVGGLFFLAVCSLYFWACGKVSLPVLWVFLMGFLPALPAAALAARKLARPGRVLKDLLWTTAGFSIYFWATVLLSHIRLGGGD